MCGREWKTGVRHLFRVLFTSKQKIPPIDWLWIFLRWPMAVRRAFSRSRGVVISTGHGHKRPNQGGHGEDLWSLAAADQKNHPDLRLHDATRWRPQEDKSQGLRRLSAGGWEI